MLHACESLVEATEAETEIFMFNTQRVQNGGG
jgi:hypothetical protein